jgi:hypothetical protein
MQLDMSDTQTKDELIEQILIELGTFLRMRINAYIKKHYDGNKYRLINGLLAYPRNTPAEANYFELEGYLSAFFRVQFNGVRLSSEGLFYDFIWDISDTDTTEDTGAPYAEDMGVHFRLNEEEKIEMGSVFREELASLQQDKLANVLDEIRFEFYRQAFSDSS